MHTPRKRFGQHFLTDMAIVQRIVAAIAPKPNDHLVEIGPGQGAITFPLLKIINQLTVIELDRDLIAALEASPYADKLQIYAGDVLQFDFAQLKNDERPLRVIGNLPYNISTPLIFHLLEYADQIGDMVFMLQREVAERIAAQPDTDAYGRLSVMVQYYCKVELLFDVPPSAFNPPPQVMSSILRIIPHQHYPARAKDEVLFAAIVKHAFGQRRKTLRNSLRDLIDDAAWAAIPVASDLRAEKLSVSDFVMISNAMSEKE